ncbi:hypothetical protein ZIOFF_071280 [Zingiber officinale]|uniref:Uncharacterized protein n=1 Tax=Zingiber officinale TaxID=94328 RepID=A0A8J5EUC8_ZINOF|nr:hypothetical protein ZIOFF_071280 [Zingiber officinale]
MGLGLLHFDGHVVDNDGPTPESGRGRAEAACVVSVPDPWSRLELSTSPQGISATLTQFLASCLLSDVSGSCRRVIWLSDADKGKGYAVDFLSLSLHAVSRDLETYPFPWATGKLIEIGDEDEESESSDSESNDDLELSKVTEMRLLPSGAGKCVAESFVVNFLFNAIMSVFVKVGKNLMQLALLHHGF